MPATFADDPLFPADPLQAVPLKVELRLPLANVLKAKPDDELAGEFILDDGSLFQVLVSPRGKSRLEHCSFVPLWLNFKKSETNETLLAGQNKLKLVTHCSNKFAAREYLAREMLAYRLLNLLTDYSFRVRALQITYVDTVRDRSEDRFAFLIEHKKRLAKRLGAKLVDTSGIRIDALDADYAGLIGLYSFMIGNTDFSMRRGPAGGCCHNAVPISMASKLLPVPYDFDSTGLVNPPYAGPSPNLRIRRLTQRLYRGYCQHNELLPGLIEEFARNKAALFDVVEHFQDIPGVRAERAAKYLAGFFDVIESERLQQSKLIKRCR